MSTYGVDIRRDKMRQESHEIIGETWKYRVSYSNISLRVIFVRAS